jgi:hypothetical protein
MSTRLSALFAAWLVALPLLAQTALLRQATPLPPTGYEERAKLVRTALFVDRMVYWDDDPVAQGLAMFLGQATAGKQVKLELFGAGDAALASAEVDPQGQPKVALVLNVGHLPPGAYRLRATLPAEPPVVAETTFAREAKRSPPLPFPAAGLPLEVEPQQAAPDGAWPITFGVPLPKGLVADPARLQLREDGQPIPCHVAPAATWHPPATGFAPSLSWVHLSFVARYQAGQPRAYTLHLLDAPAAPPAPAAPLRVETTPERFTVHHGRIVFAVNRKGFTGIAEAWYDRDGDGQVTELERVIAPRQDTPLGPFLTDARDVRFEAARDAAATVEIEEQSATRLVLAARGWYANPELSSQAGPPPAQFVVRFIVTAGIPEIQVQHHTVIAADTHSTRFREIGFAVPIVGAEEAIFGQDGEEVRTKLPAGTRPAYQVQYRWDRARVADLPKPGRNPGEVLFEAKEGKRTDGRLSLPLGPAAAADALEDDRPTLTALVRYMPEKFPRELAASRAALTVYSWPAHGLATFTTEEKLGRQEIYKLRWLHEGALLDFRFPSDAYTVLREWQNRIQWDPEDMLGTAVNSNARGVALNSEFALRLAPAAEATLPLARLYQAQPFARTPGTWNAATGVLGPLAPRAPADSPFAAMETELDSAYPDYLKAVVERGAEFGMFIYGNTHNNLMPQENGVDLHRVWQASHYRQVWEPWLLFFRGNDFALLPWARAYADHFTDVDTVNYAESERLPLKSHQPGAMYHAKGFVPWGAKVYGQKATDSYLGIWGHWINSTAFLLRWQLAAHARSRDVGQLWLDSTKASKYYHGASREIGNTANELMMWYPQVWDADLLPLMHDMANGMLNIRLAEWPANYHHPWFNPFWFVTWYAHARDPRVPARVAEYIGPDKFGGSATMHALLYWANGTTEYLPRYSDNYLSLALQVYRHPGDPLDGYRTRFLSDPYTHRQQWPYWLAAAEAAKLPGLAQAKLRSVYPSASAHDWFIESESPAVEVLALDPDDRAFTVTLHSPGGTDEGPMSLRVISPALKLPVQKSLRTTEEGRQIRYEGERALRFPIAKDGEQGIYRIDIRTHQVNFLSPYTDLPHEAARLAPGRGYSVHHNLDHFVQPVALTGPATLRLKAIIDRTRAYPVYVRLEDAGGKLITETSLLPSAQRAQLELTLDPAQHPAPWRLRTIGTFVLTADGPAKSFLIATQAEAATTLAAALAAPAR